MTQVLSQEIDLAVGPPSLSEALHRAAEGISDLVVDLGPGGRIGGLTPARETRLLLRADVTGLHEALALAEHVDVARLFLRIDGSDPQRGPAAVGTLVGAGFRVFGLDDAAALWWAVDPWNAEDLERVGDAASALLAVRGERVLAVAAFLHQGQLRGAERAHLEWVRAMQARGHLVHTFSGVGADVPARLTAEGLAGSRHSLSWWAGSADWRTASAGVEQVCVELAAINPDVVLTHTAVLPGGALAARRLGIPHVWYVHEYLDLDHDMPLPCPVRELGDAIVGLSDAVVANSPSVFRHLFGERPPVLAIPAAQLVRVAPPRTSMPAQPVVGYLGGVTRRKGLVEFVEAVALLRERGLGVGARIFGLAHEPEFLDALEALVDERGLRGTVEFMGEWPDPVQALAEVDVVAVPSWHEAFGRVPLEAACAGVPVVYSDAGGMSDYMVDGVTGVAVRPRDAHSLADGLQRVIADEELRTRLADSAFDTLRAQFAGLAVADALESVLAQVVVARPSGVDRTLGREEVRTAARERVAAVAQAAGEVASARAEREQVVGALADTQAYVEVLRAEADSARVESGRAADRLERVSAQLAVVRGERDQVVGALADTQAYVEVLRAEADEARAEADEARAEAAHESARALEALDGLWDTQAHVASLQERLTTAERAGAAREAQIAASVAQAAVDRAWAIRAAAGADELATRLDDVRGARRQRALTRVLRPVDQLRGRPGPHWVGPTALDLIGRSGLFDPAFYLAANPDVAAAGMDPWDHYRRAGNRELRAPNALLDPREYLARFPADSLIDPDPVRDYLAAGAYVGRDPHPLFDSRWYLAGNPDVVEAGMNPLAHYLLAGAAEGRDPHPLFDARWYFAEHPEVAEAGLNPLVHYLTTGAAQGFDPHPLFRAEHYRLTNPDVVAAGMNPLVHYLLAGSAEGRRPHPDFDPAWYRSEHPDLIPEGQDPLVHYHRTGWRLGVAPRAGWVAPEGTPEACPLLDESSPRTGRAVAPAALDRRAADRGPLARDLAARAGIPATTPPAARPVKVVSFYLPQFHPIPENDQWWGQGFTEWTNVRRGNPVYEGHVQPHIPGDLGYYDLLDDAGIMHRQARMARDHGVDAFCFYVYWFAGRRLLEKPVERFLADPSIDIEFCVCWANENWTRTWDGDTTTGLAVQDHSPEDDIAFIDAMLPALRDPRAVRAGGRPLLLVYRPDLLPDAAATAARFRARCREQGLGEIALAYVRGFATPEPASIGFDFSVEFPPANSGISAITDQWPTYDGFAGTIYDLGQVAARGHLLPAEPGLWRGVCPSWDNTARRPETGAVMVGSTPELFRGWLHRAGVDTLTRFEDPSERLVWVNAWNEWAEGAHLEPDAEFGYQWLHAVRDAQEALAGVTEGTGPGVVVVAHDLHRHGAQLLSLAMASWVATVGLRLEVVALGEGALAADFAAVAPLHRVDDRDEAAMDRLAADLRSRGFATALCNSSVTGRFAAALVAAGVHVTGLVHELPEILAAEDRGPRAEAMAASVDRLVFPADLVRDRFPYPVRDAAEVVVAAQGLNAALPDLGTPQARAELRESLGLPADARVVLGVGFADLRKGFDLFCDVVQHLVDAEDESPVYGVWAGTVDTSTPAITTAASAVTGGRLVTTGFVTDVARYYRGADVLALTSREDPFPSVALEALAAGLPVVAFTGATGLGELLAQAHCPTVPVGDVPAFAGAVAVAMDGAGDAPAAQRRRELVLSRHNFHRYMMDLLAATPAALPRVSVVIPNYNYAHYLPTRIAQVTGQTLPPYEVIVLDDASTDDSVEVARAVLSGLAVPTRLVVNATNTGQPAAQWRAGAQLASGDLVWIAEADDVADPGFLAEVTAAFRAPEVVLSYCQSRQVDQDGRVMAGDYLQYTDELARDHTRRHLLPGPEEITDCLSVKNSIPNVSAVVMRRDALLAAFDAAGGEVQTLRYAGDWLLYVHLLAGGSVAFTPRALNDHRRHAGSVIGSGDAAEHVAQIERVQAVAAGIPGVRADRAAQARWVDDARRALGLV